MKNIQCASFFSGVGGIETAFKKEGFEIIYANELDKHATKTFELNHTCKIDNRDINFVKNSEIPNFDIMLAGFPCQAFSLAGYRQGFDDIQGRGSLFFELERIFIDKKPQVIFLENVKNLVTHNNGHTFQVILEKLENAGYYTKYQVQNALSHGNIPQNRERIYIVAFRNKKKYQNFEFPYPLKLTKTLGDIIDFDEKVADCFYYTALNCKFYDILSEHIVHSNTVYQWRRTYVRENKNFVCPTLTANMGTGGHNVPLIKSKYGIRKLTPLECFKIQGYSSDFQIPSELANTHAYKQAGNSVVVPVIQRIASQIYKVL